MGHAIASRRRRPSSQASIVDGMQKLVAVTSEQTATSTPPRTSPADVAFTLYAIASAASQAIQLEEPGASARARRCMRALLGGA